ncbi:unnamed protein product [Euphydryas editha]|uniref:Tc1-like transposase DDE domain-containing protein n=1 Tax=Euphydryas editha TaxID=104508 RepID=A0AAU9V8A1_EUPED|nr:unnamed protein product [Euphydryas editha]
MDPQPSTSQKDVDVFLSPRKKRPRKAFTVTEKVMIRNAYKYVKNEISTQLDAFEVVEENECEVNKGAPPTPPQKTGPKRSFKDKIDEFTFSAIRRIVHQFLYRNEPPTIAKILQVINDDPEMPKVSKDTLRKFLKHLNFKFVARSRKSTLIDRNDIITWRQRYLRSTCQFRREGRHIYYQDETWVNAVCFEEWFAGVLPKLRSNSIVVMDNAPYHSRKLETAPKMSWKKAAIQDWLLNKTIHYKPDMVKATLLELVPHNESFNKYAVDEMAAQHGITVLRLPPYHCELNPIELIWAQVKGHVAQNNKAFKLTDVRNLFEEGIKKITATEWSKCVSHVVKEEEKMSRLDMLIDNITDTFIINVTESDSDSDSDDL